MSNADDFTLIGSAFIPGRPRPQGSKSAAVKNGRVVMWETSKELKNWRGQVIAELQRLNPYQVTLAQPWHKAVTLMVEFAFEQPKSNRQEFPIGKPDLDKLVRGICDCLEQAKWVANDSQIVTIHAIKSWCGPNGQPGAYISLHKIDPLTERDLRLEQFQTLRKTRQTEVLP